MEEQQSLSTKQECYKIRQQEKLNKQKQLKQKKLHKRILLWSIVVLAVSAAIFGMTQLAQTSEDSVKVKNKSAFVADVSGNDWVKGNTKSNIVLIEYSDFQCPACGRYYPILKELSQEFKNNIQFVYRHFPLRQIHANAQFAAQAAEAAGKQGKFWEMHDVIFEKQSEWSNQKREQVEENFISYARVLNIDVTQFKEDLNSKEVIDKVNNSYQGGIKARVNSTPTFFLNGEKIQNPRSYEEFRNVINKALDSSS